MQARGYGALQLAGKAKKKIKHAGILEINHFFLACKVGATKNF
jgi:hypothetical protein